MTAPVLVVIDMQQVFGDPASPWFTQRFAEAEAVIAGMLPAFGDRVVFTRFVAPERPQGAWGPYYEQWPFALVPADDPIYDQVLAFRDTGHPVVSAPTLGKWGPALREAIGIPAGHDLGEAFTRLSSGLGLPLRLGQMGLDRDTVEAAAPLAERDHTNGTNPRRATSRDYFAMMLDAL